MNYDQYYQTGGTYVIPSEVFNELLAENKHLLDLQKNMDKQYEKLEQENKKLKQWDNNKDSRNSRQRVANKKLLKKNEVLEYNWNELINWLDDRLDWMDDSDLWEIERIEIRQILSKMQELEKGGNNG